MNVHLSVTPAEYRRILKEAGRDAKETVHSKSGQVLFATIPVKLYVDTNEYRKSMAIYDPTYSATHVRIEERL